MSMNNPFKWHILPNLLFVALDVTIFGFYLIARLNWKKQAEPERNKNEHRQWQTNRRIIDGKFPRPNGCDVMMSI